MTSEPSPLPYRDTKPVGAADFYFAINATFRFILQRFGLEGLRGYWTDLGAQYYAPVSAAWQQRGLPGVAAYWRAFFAAESVFASIRRHTGFRLGTGVQTCALPISCAPAEHAYRRVEAAS